MTRSHLCNQSLFRNGVRAHLDVYVCVIWLIQVYVMTPSDVRHDIFTPPCVCVPCLTHMCAMTPWEICNMNHLHLCNHSAKSSFEMACILTLMCVCDMTHSDVFHDSPRYETWLIHTTIHFKTLYTTLGQLQKIAHHPIRQYMCVYIYVDICIYICMLGKQTAQFTTTIATTINLTKWNRNTHVYT